MLYHLGVGNDLLIRGWLKNARIESFCLHWRQVLEFLSATHDVLGSRDKHGTKREVRRDIRAGHFFTDPDSARLPRALEIAPDFRGWKVAVGQYVAHLTFGRKTKGDKIQWPFAELSGELARLLRECAANADRCVGPFAWLADDFHRKCGAARPVRDVDYYRTRNRPGRDGMSVTTGSGS